MILCILVHVIFALMFAALAFTSNTGAAAALFGISAGINAGAAVLHGCMRFGGRS